MSEPSYVRWFDDIRLPDVSSVSARRPGARRFRAHRSPAHRLRRGFDSISVNAASLLRTLIAAHEAEQQQTKLRPKDEELTIFPAGGGDKATREPVRRKGTAADQHHSRPGDGQ